LIALAVFETFKECSIRCHVQGVLDQVPRNVGHVSGFPREHAHVAPQEPDERFFLFRIQVGPDKGHLARIVIDQLDLLVLVGLDVLPRYLAL
jgi:hypothetical protein